MPTSLRWPALLAVLATMACGSSSSATGPTGPTGPTGNPPHEKTVQIVASGGGYQLLRSGVPYPIRGAGGSASLATLAAAGGNSTRTWGPDESILGAAAAHGISVTLGFWTLDETAVLDFVRRHKGDPALLMWALGNELETRTADQPALWRQVNALALQVKALDPDHPVITVVAEVGGDKLALLDRYAPDLDAVGINSYAGITSLPQRVAASGFSRPWLVTEFGPVGWWEAPTTGWGAPVEDSSTAKAAHYLQGWQHAVQGQPTCLGGYAFLWGDKVEETHTWFGMLLPTALGGGSLGAVDAMTFAWTGAWPTTRAPQIDGAIPGGLRLVPHGSAGDGTQRSFAAGSQVDAAVDATDPGGAPLSFAWELRADGASGAIAGAVVSASGATAVLMLPSTPGTYRAFVYVHGAAGHAATATAPIQAQ